MVYNATSWGAKLLMQAAYNTKARPALEPIPCRIEHSLGKAHVLGLVSYACLHAMGCM